mgnify:FL=1
MNGREAALKVLYEIDKNGAYCDKALKNQLEKCEVSDNDKRLASELVYGVTDKRRRLDYIIENYSSQRLKKLSVWILNILRMGVYQILFLDKIPGSAAVNESVKLARRYGHNASAGFVNAVLRTVAREGDVRYTDNDIAIYYSVPDWLDSMLAGMYGREKTVKMYEAFSKPSPTTVRVNTLKAQPSEVKESLSEGGVHVMGTEYDDMLEISDFGDISKLPQYLDGLITPQDISAYRVCTVLKPKPGERIIDMCAAPGGKTTHIAQLCENDAKITAFDISSHKLDIINNNCTRLGITCVKTELSDGTVYNEKYAGTADRVLADVPCSGLGVIGKKFDIKWSRSPEGIDELIKIQNKIIANAGAYLKPGGVLVYSTCTLNKNENEEVARRFARENSYEITFEETIMPYSGSDGFYICKMRKGR